MLQMSVEEVHNGHVTRFKQYVIVTWQGLSGHVTHLKKYMFMLQRSRDMHMLPNYKCIDIHVEIVYIMFKWGKDFH